MSYLQGHKNKLLINDCESLDVRWKSGDDRNNQ